MSIFQAIVDSDKAKAVLGKNPCRFYPFGYAPKEKLMPVYATYQVVGGNPENTIADRPKTDRQLIQIDVYAKTAGEAESVALIMRGAIELRAHITSFRSAERDKETQLFRASFDVTYFTNF